MLKAMLVGQDRQHPLQPLVGELHDPAAALANEVLVVRLGRHGLVPLEAFAEVMGPYQTTLDQEIEGTVDGGGSHPLSPLFQLPADRVDGEVFRRQEDDLGHQIALPSDRLVMLPKMTAKTFGVGRGFRLIEAGHRA